MNQEVKIFPRLSAFGFLKWNFINFCEIFRFFEFNSLQIIGNHRKKAWRRKEDSI